MALKAADPNAVKHRVLHHLLQNPQGIHFGDFNTDPQLGGEKVSDSSEREAESLTEHMKTRETTALANVLAALTRLLHKYKSGLRIKKVQEFLLVRYNIDLQRFSVAQGYKDTLEFLDHNMPHLDIRARENRTGFVIQLPKVQHRSDLSSVVEQMPQKQRVPGLSPSVHPEEGLSGLPISAIAENLMESRACQASVLIRNILEGCPHGLKVKKLKKFIKENHGFDLESFCHVLGYNSVESYLQDVPGLFFQNNNRTQNCVIHLQSRSSSPAPSLDTDFSVCNSNGIHKGLTAKDSGTTNTAPALDTGASVCNSNAASQRTAEKPDLGTIFTPVLDVFQSHPNGLNLKELKETLKKKHGFDLDAVSHELGYGHVIAFLLNITGLSFTFTSGQWPSNCVIRLLSDRNGLSSLRLSNGPSLEKFPSPNDPDVLPQPLKETQPASHAPPPSCSSSSLGSEEFVRKSENPNQNMLEKMPAVGISASSQSSASLTESKEKPAVTSKSSNQNVLGKKPAELTEVLALITNLLSLYKSGLRVKKMQELLLTTDKFDLEKYSIDLGYKDSLEFLERQMPKLEIKSREDRAKCVVQIGSGESKTNSKQRSSSSQKTKIAKCPDNGAIPSVAYVPVPRSKPTKTNALPDSRPANSAHDSAGICKPSFAVQESSLCRSQIQSSAASTSLAAPALENKLPVMHSKPPPLLHSHGSLSNQQRNFSQPFSSIPPQQPEAYQRIEPSPAEKAPAQSNGQSSKDLGELRQQVSHILSRCPEGMSLFQFRAAYSAVYQQHLPLGNASSAKQRLMEMPDVVTLLGYGVQTMLLPASTQPLAAKSDQPVSCKLENVSQIPACSLPISPAVAKPTSVVKPYSASWAAETTQPHAICSLSSDPFNHPLKEMKNACSLQKHENARTNSEVHVIKPGLPMIRHGETDLGQPADPSATVLSGPWPPLSSLRSSEPGQISKKSFLLPQVQKAPKPLRTVPEMVRTRPKQLDPHQSPVVLPEASQTRRWAEVVKSNNLKSRTVIPAGPWLSSSSTSTHSHVQPISCSSSAWNQQVAHPSLSAFSLHPAAFLPVSRKPPGIQFSNTTLSTSSVIRPAPQISLFKPVSSIQIPEDANCAHIGPEQNSFSQRQEVSETVACVTNVTPVRSVRMHTPVSSPQQTLSSLQPSRSNIFSGPHLDSLPDNYFPNNSLVRDVSSSKASSELPAFRQQKQSSDGNTLAAPASTLSLIAQSSHTNTAQQPFFSVSNDPQPLRSKPRTATYQKRTEVDSSIATSSLNPVSLLSSPLGSPTASSGQLSYASSHISNQSSMPSQPWDYLHQEQDATVNHSKIITDTRSTTLPSSPLKTPPTFSRQPSFPSSVDYGASNRRDRPRSVFTSAGLQDSSQFSSSPLMNRSSNKLSDKCVIL